MKFLIRNDDVAADTSLEEITRFCEICDQHGFPIMHAIIPFGEAKKIKSKLSNSEIQTLSHKPLADNADVVKYLLSRQDLIGVHGLWHTHVPTDDEIKTGREYLESLGFTPTYFVPPFNEGIYPGQVAGLTTCQLAEARGERLEAFLDAGTPNALIMYLHSWRFGHPKWYTFEQLDRALARLAAL